MVDLNVVGVEGLTDDDADYSKFTKTDSLLRSVAPTIEEPKLKIETLHASQLTKVSLWYLAGLIYSIIINVVYIVLSNTHWKEEVEVGNFTYTFITPPFAYSVVEVTIECTLAILSFASTAVYCIAILTTSKERRTREMIFVVILGIAMTIVYIPITELQGDSSENVLSEYFLRLLEVTSVLRGTLVLFGFSFYTWSTVLSFQYSHPKVFGRSYYIKIGILALFLVVRIVGSSTLHVHMGSMPFTSFTVGAVKIFTQRVGVGSAVMFTVICSTLLEGLIVAGIFFDLQETGRIVDSLDYISYRSLQIGFRQFRYYLSVTFIVTLTSSLVNILLTSADTFLFVAKYTGVVFFEEGQGRLTYLSLVPIFAVQQLYYMLPAASPGLMSILCCRWRKTELSSSQSVNSYRPFERNGLSFKPSTLVMETCILSFNLSWLMYSYGKVGKENRTPQDFGNHNYRITCYKMDPGTDTHALVFESPDRIVVSFKGTTSMKNVQTDFQTKMVPIEDWSKGSDDWVLGSETKDHGNRRFWNRRRALVHNGFIGAYSKVRDTIVAEVTALYEKNPRPILVTGHSLGGALATISSYDLSKLLKPPEGMFVFTFGSPRVGNGAFAAKYNAEVPCHWRIVHAMDPVTKLPPAMFFRHVGQSALLTEEGDLFIDPTMFEMSWMHSDLLARFTLKTHKNSGYAKSLGEFVRKRHGERMHYKGEIWKLRETKSREAKSNNKSFVQEWFRLSTRGTNTNTRSVL